MERGLAELLIKGLNRLDLKLENLVGQCYDGGSNMREEYQGVATRLRRVAPLGKLRIYDVVFSNLI